MADDKDNDKAAPKPASVPGREARPMIKRFYKAVSVAGGNDGFAVHLDGRPVRTPAKAQLRVASENLASAIAVEWEAQHKEILPATMPLTTLVCTAIDAVAANMTDVAAEIAKYAGSDLLCYRAEGPRDLVERQEAGWDPVLAWAAREFGTPFRCTQGLMAVEQSPKIAAEILEILQPLGPVRLSAVHVLTTLTGSAVLAIGVLLDQLTIESAWRLAHIDEDWQSEKWGADREAQDRMAARLRTAQAAVTAIELTKVED